MPWRAFMPSAMVMVAASLVAAPAGQAANPTLADIQKLQHGAEASRGAAMRLSPAFAPRGSTHLLLAQATQPQGPAAPGAPQAQPATNDAAGTAFWSEIRDSRDPAKFEEFLQRFPDHPLAPVAKAKLDAIIVRAAEDKQQAAPAQQAAPSQEDVDPEEARQELATNLQTLLKEINCYTSTVDGLWGRGSRAAMQRFNALSGEDLPVDDPSIEAVDALEAWKGGKCAVAAKPRPRQRAVKSRPRGSTTTRQRAQPTRREAPATTRSPIGIGIGIGGIGIGF